MPYQGAPINLPIRVLEFSSYMLQAGDANAMLRLGTSSNSTVHLPSEAIFPAGAQVLIVRNGIGPLSVNFSPSNATLHAPGDARELRAQYSAATLIHLGNNEWLLTGDVV